MVIAAGGRIFSSTRRGIRQTLNRLFAGGCLSGKLGCSQHANGLGGIKLFAAGGNDEQSAPFFDNPSAFRGERR
jgi:hypothetical protein